LSLPTTPELIASLDEELVDLLYERLKLAAYLPPLEAPEDVAREVLRMRNLCGAYHVPRELGETMVLALIEAQKKFKSA
jgi:hypothetical protein